VDTHRGAVWSDSSWSLLASVAHARGARRRAACGVGWPRDGLTPALPAFVSPRQTQAPAVLDHAGALPQRDQHVGPAFDRRSVGRHRQGVVLDAGQVFDDVIAADVREVELI